MQEFKLDFKLSESSPISTESQIVFGWASVTNLADGTPVVDADDHMIDIQDLEEAAYLFVRQGSMQGSVEHEYMYAGWICESVVFTKAKMRALGIPDGVVPEGWWVGMYIPDKELFELVKDGKFSMFSIAGQALATESETSNT